MPCTLAQCFCVPTASPALKRGIMLMQISSIHIFNGLYEVLNVLPVIIPLKRIKENKSSNLPRVFQTILCNVT
jgi:hypothetical protein